MCPTGIRPTQRTILGPVTTSGQRDRVESYLRIGRDEGAADTNPSMRILQEEIFGPVISKSIPRG